MQCIVGSAHHLCAKRAYQYPVLQYIVVLLRSVTEMHFGLEAERLRDGGGGRYGAVSGTSALEVHAKIRSSNCYCERDIDSHFTPATSRAARVSPMNGLCGCNPCRHRPSHRAAVCGKDSPCPCTYSRATMISLIWQACRSWFDRRTQPPP